MKIITLEECGSTNDEAWRYLPALEACSAVLVRARRQTQGRGQHGRNWVGQEGNLMVSLLVRSPRLRESLRWFPVAAGVAAIEALTKTLEHNKNLGFLRLKWPNDIYFNDRKLGGVLCESRILGDHVQGAVIGLGLNIVSAPEVSGQLTASLREHFLDNAVLTAEDAEPLMTEFIKHWAANFLDWMHRLDQGLLDQLFASANRSVIDLPSRLDDSQYQLDH